MTSLVDYTPDYPDDYPDNHDGPQHLITQVTYRLNSGQLARQAYDFGGKDPIEEVEAKLSSGKLLQVDSIAPASDNSTASIFIRPESVSAVLMVVEGARDPEPPGRETESAEGATEA